MRLAFFLSLLGEALTDQVGPESHPQSGRPATDWLQHQPDPALRRDSRARIDTPHGVVFPRGATI